MRYLYSIADGGNRSRDNHHGAKETIVRIAIFHDNFETYTYNYVPTYFKFNVTIKVRYAYAALTVFFSLYYRIRLFWKNWNDTAAAIKQVYTSKGIPQGNLIIRDSSIGTDEARPLDQYLACVTFCLRQKLTGLAPDLVIPTSAFPILQFQHQMLTVYE